MDNWHPKPLRPASENPIFQEPEDTYVVKAMTPMQRQRYEDGSQHSKARPSRLGPPGVSLVLGEDKIDKSKSVNVDRDDGDRDDVDPDEVVKNYLKAESCEEDSEKGVVSEVGSAAGRVAKQTASTAYGLANQK